MVAGQANNNKGSYWWDLHRGSLLTNNLTGVHNSSNREENKCRRGCISHSRQHSWPMAEMGPWELVALAKQEGGMKLLGLVGPEDHHRAAWSLTLHLTLGNLRRQRRVC